MNFSYIALSKTYIRLVFQPRWASACINQKGKYLTSILYNPYHKHRSPCSLTEALSCLASLGRFPRSRRRTPSPCNLFSEAHQGRRQNDTVSLFISPFQQRNCSPLPKIVTKPRGQKRGGTPAIKTDKRPRLVPSILRKFSIGSFRINSVFGTDIYAKGSDFSRADTFVNEYLVNMRLFYARGKGSTTGKTC